MAITCSALKVRTHPINGPSLVVTGDDLDGDLIGYYPGQDPTLTYTKCSYGPDSNGTTICVLVPCCELIMSVTGVVDKPTEDPPAANDYYDCDAYCDDFNKTFTLQRDTPCDWFGSTEADNSGEPPCYYPPGDPLEGDPALVPFNKATSGGVSVVFNLLGDGSVDVGINAGFELFDASSFLQMDGLGFLLFENVPSGVCKVIDERDANWTVPQEAFNISGTACDLESAEMVISKGDCPGNESLLVNYTRAFFETDSNFYNFFFR